MPSKLSLFLIGSLAVNAALLGIVAGRFLNSSNAASKEPTVQMQLERYGPTSDVVADAWSKLPDEDRKVLRQELRDSWKALEGERKRLSEAGKHVYDAALEQPFDEANLRDAVTIFQQREQRLQQAAEDILIRHIGKMPAEARATAAVGLLTPFNARMQRSGEGKPRGDKAPALAPIPGTNPAKPAAPAPH
jgi:uncharacterized membrane protein